MKNRFLPFSIVLTSAALLSACGGGDAGFSPSLSQDQLQYESLTKTPNRAYSVSWHLLNSGTPVPGVHYIYANGVALNKSPATSTDAKMTGESYLTLSQLSVSNSSRPNRYVVNGAIVTSLGDWRAKVSYQGSAVRVDALASDGTVAATQLRSDYSSVALTGAVVSAPVDVAHWLNSLYFNPLLLNRTSVWGDKSAYVKYTATNVGDSYSVQDAGGVETFDASPTPFSKETSVANLMAAGGISLDGVTYTMSTGAVSQINGVTMYIASAQRTNVTTPSFRTFFDLGGNVYQGYLIKDGTVLGGNVYNTIVDGVVTPNYSQKFQVRFNKAAIDSLRGAITF